ncbi:MAG TPA: hypothetical protein VLB46_22920 [Pyrinomonadaceae bacterium]|nr:hypothetical protein [Pyrinomonadaceae bacterium]
MSIKLAQATQQVTNFADALKGWVMVVLTFVFILLYGAALVGWLKPLADDKMVLRLEPIIFVIIGYYFGRLPGLQNEHTLREELGRQTQKADAAQYAKEQALLKREGLEEKLKNVAAALGPSASMPTTAGANDHREFTNNPGFGRNIDVALKIINHN